ncbi:MAG: gamma-glutamylcyclotransferase [Alphaproteobacteria bacterium]|nr:MAG: gamma-glutamylcyclotransferase [Alphaproteobacteria bacterium]
MDRQDVRLFSYGTLRLPAVQQGTFGRLLDGTPDALLGYRLQPLAISDPAVVALSGAAVHRIARRTGDPADRIEGVVFAITQAELEAGDRYEVDVYGRIEETLESGICAFVYVGPPLDPEAI